MINNSDFVIERGTLKKYLGSEKHVIIPEGVKTIAGYALRGAKCISIQLPDSVVKISENAFRDCETLETVNIPIGIKSIGDEAFRNCNNLKEVMFSSEPEIIGTLAFYGCWKLIKNSAGLTESVREFLNRMRDGILTLEEGKRLYEYSKAKGTITIKGFSGVSMQAWDGKKYPYSFGGKENFLIIPVSIEGIPVVKAPSKQIPDNAIVYCSQEHFEKLPRENKANLSALWLNNDPMIRDELTSKIEMFIKKYSDDVARALENYDNVKAYKSFLEIAKPKHALIEKMIEQCEGKVEILAVLLEKNSKTKTAISDISLDDKPKMTVTELKKLWTYDTFIENKTQEKSIRLTNYKGHDKHVEVPAFIGKVKVSEIVGTFPPEVESVVFENPEIEVKCSFRNCKSMVDSNGFIILNIGSRCVLTDYVGSKDIKTLVIPNGVTENCYGTFREMDMREVILPEGFEKLANGSFMNCKKLQHIHLSDSIQHIGQMAFAGCVVLEQMYIPKGLTQTDFYGHLYYNKPNAIIYGEHESQAFLYANERGISFVEGRPQEILMPDFIVRDGVLKAYLGNDSNIVIPESVVEIGAFTFSKNKEIESVFVGNEVRVIGEYAFSNCNNLAKVRIDGNVERIENCAFEFTGITEVVIESGVKKIGESAFAYLSHNGAKIIVPESIQEIGENAFYSNFKKTTLYVKEGSYAEQYAKENEILFQVQ